VKDLDYYSKLGTALWLMNQSPYHRQWPLYDVDIDLVPPLCLNQCKFYFDEQQNPIGFVTWSTITEATKNRLVFEQGQMQWQEWNQGEQLLFNDFIAPFGHTRELLRDLRSMNWPHKVAFSLRRSPNGRVKKINYWWHQTDYKDAGLQKNREQLNIS